MNIYNMIKCVTGVGLTFISTSVLASPYDGSSVLFGCFINGKVNKEVTVLRNDKEVTYMFGKSDPTGENGVEPEIKLTKNIKELNKSWNYSRAEGVSLHTLNIPNKDYVYRISYLDNGKDQSGEVTVIKSGKQIALIECNDVWEQHLDNEVMMQDIPEEDTHDNNLIITTEQNHRPESENKMQPPVKVKIQDIPYDFKGDSSAEHTVRRHVYIYSIVDNVTITGISIDRGSCYRTNINPVRLAYGSRYDLSLKLSQQVAYASSGWNWLTFNDKYSKCMWSEVEVKTNTGNYKFNFSI